MSLDAIFQHRAAFLQRNWLKGVRAFQKHTGMGNITSSTRSDHGDEDDDRPRKRQRLATPESMNLDSCIASPRSPESRSALRIEVLKIFHKDSRKIKPDVSASVPRELLVSKANCRITISDVSSGNPRVLHCQSQGCEIKTFQNPVGPHRVARVQSEPFYIPEKNLHIRRKDDGSFDMSDSYELIIELEADADGEWPPLTAADFGIESLLPGLPADSDRKVIISGRFISKLSGKTRAVLSLSSDYVSNCPVRDTDYIIETHLKWATGFKALDGPERNTCITAIDPGIHFDDEDDGTSMNDIDGLFPEDSGDDRSSRRERSRSLRARERPKSYNIKQLSDQTVGRKKRQARNARLKGNVTYFLPTDQPVSLDHFRCISCGAYHRSLQQLQAHMQTNHPAYEYMLEMTSQGPQFRVTSRLDVSGMPSQTIQLQRPTAPFNLSSFVLGDDSWVTSRIKSEDAEDNPLAFTKLQFGATHAPTPVPRFPLRAELTTKRSDTGDVLAPNTSTPLFHPISKATIKPGQKVPIIKPDSTWLLQKHRAAIAEFSDVTLPEREYIWEWDEYILQHNLTASVYFPKAWLGFVQEKADWLVEKPHRMIEFGKHSCVLMVRDLLNDAVFKDAFTFINGARSRLAAKKIQTREDLKDSGQTSSSPPSPPKYGEPMKGVSGCKICGLPVNGPRQLICTNRVCL